MATDLMKAKIDFAWNLLQKLKSGEEDLFCSPVSILAAFSMLLAGAKGQCGTELKSALGLADIPDAKLHSVVSNFLTNLVRGAEGVTIKLANRAYIQTGYPLLDEFMAIIKGSYKADIGQVDFKQAADCCKAINSWVEEQTNNKIKDLVSPSGLPPDTRLLLVNAIYFKGKWMNPFNPGKTSPEPFHLTPTRTETVEMMHGEDFYPFAKDSKLGCRIAGFNFANERFVMLVILPEQRCGLAALEDKLSGGAVNGLIRKMEPAAIEVSLPRFRIESSLDLGSAMQRLGAGSVFDRGSADLSGITSAEQLFVSKAVHKSFLAVNEEGAEAAAATGMFCEPMCLFMGDDKMVVDHPFLVAIYDSAENAIAFLGRVFNPKE